jgi:hypothetical protein
MSIDPTYTREQVEGLARDARHAVQLSSEQRAAGRDERADQFLALSQARSLACIATVLAEGVIEHTGDVNTRAG